MPDEIVKLENLTLSEIRERLESLKIPMAMSTLHEVISKGDVAEQLQKQRLGNKTLYPPGAVAILAETIQTIRGDKRLTFDSAPDVMRQIISKEPSQALSVIGEKPKDSEITRYGDSALTVLSEIRELLKQTPTEDNLLSLREAKAAFPHVPLDALRSLRVPVGKRLYVKRSAILRYIASL